MNFPSRIEAFFSERFDSQPALYVPSGRFGLWLAALHTLPPAARVLLSPVTCEQVLYALLAAGMKPVFGPVNPATGNLDPCAVSPAQWDSIDAVLTTNLYGMPDDMVRLQEVKERHGVTLIEDACHAFDSSVGGQRIGSFGTCSVFSLAKHAGGSGGVLLFRDEKDRPALVAMMRAGLGSPLLNRLQSLTSRLRSRLGRASASPVAGAGHRDALERPALDHAVSKAPNIKAFDLFLGAGGSSYRCFPPLKAQAATMQALDNWEAEARHCRESVRTFQKSGLVPRDIVLPEDSTLLRVPLFVENREETITQLAAEGIPISLVYDPPLHEHCPWIPSIAAHWTPAQSRWCAKVLPIAPQKLAMAAASSLAGKQTPATDLPE